MNPAQDDEAVPAGADPEDSTTWCTYGRTLDEDTCDMGIEGLEACPYLVVLHGEDRGRSFALDRPQLTLGRSDVADIVLSDKRVSRVHCIFKVNGQDVEVCDNGSHNGTFVDNHRVDSAALPTHSQLRIGRTIMRVEYKADAQIEMEDSLFRAATTDSLTGLSNRRYFTEQAHADVSLSDRHNRDMCAVMLDVDFFKRVNDTHGHQAGDSVLVALAGLLQAIKRHEDLLARWGGEEFLYLLHEVALPDAVTFSERVRQAVEKHDFHHRDVHIPVTISAGVSCLHHGESLESLIDRADHALYVAKQKGRNRVETEESAMN